MTDKLATAFLNLYNITLYARSHFGGERFCAGWRDVLNYSHHEGANA